MEKSRIRLCLAIVLLWTSPAAAQVQGRIRRVGIFEGGAPLARPGKWCFVEVELRNGDTKPLDGELHVEQLDRDGDVVMSVEPVALVPEGPWRPYEVYFVPNQSENNNAIRVTLFDADGRLIRLLADTGEEVGALICPTFTALSAEELLILDLTTPSKLPHVAALDTRQQRNEGDHTNLRVIRGLSPKELPRRWQGLEAVDAMVWDDADPSALSQQQVDALTDWVRHGGRLLITAGRNWQMLASSSLAPVLPVTITGADNQREALEFLDILKNDIYEGLLARDYNRRPILRCRMTKTSNAIGIPSECPNEQIAYRNLLGRGTLTFVGASLRQLLPPPAPPPAPPESAAEDAPASNTDRTEFEAVCERVIGWTFLGLPKVIEEGRTAYLTAEPVNLFDLVRQTIGFQTLSAAFLVFAIIFAIVYVMIATAGSYWYLKRRAWQHHCWTAFAIVSLAGIVVGTGMVWTLRGVSTKVWETTVIDAKAGEDYGYATCLFGVKTPDHTRLDLRLPAGGANAPGAGRFGALRVMPRSTSYDVVESRYVAPDAFRSVRAGAMLEGVPVRATLKEFEGAWDGPLAGTLEAKFIIHEGEEGRIGDGSYILNRLNVNLNGCRILIDAAEIAGGGPTNTTLCLALGSLPASGPGSELNGEALRQRLYFLAGEGADAEPTPILNRELRLDRAVRQWQSEVRSFGMLGVGGDDQAPKPLLSTSQEYASLLLLSVFDLLEAPTTGQRAPHRSHGRSLDCTHQITRETAVLIGYTNEAPPAVLTANGRNLLPEKSRTMYRFVIPVERRQRDR
jgi:hypothetical protein